MTNRTIKNLKEMKKIITIVTALIMAVNVWAQAPNSMSYQAVIRDAGNALVTSQAIGIQISILQGSATGTAVYVETQTPTSNTNGLISLEIGNGTAITGDFSTIDWGDGPYFIQTETDPTGGMNYTITGTSQLLSVPYALRATLADSVVGGTGMQLDSTTIANFGFITEDTDTRIDSMGIANFGFITEDTDTQLDSTDITNLGFVAGNELPQAPNTGDMTYWNGTDWVAITGGAEGAILQFLAGTPTWVVPRAEVGDFRDGGIVFWVDPADTTRQSGLVVDLADLGGLTAWGCSATTITGADGTDIGDGAQNTTDILAECTEAGIAARLCDTSTNGGFTDWFLPSTDELKEIENNIEIINAAITNNGGTIIPFPLTDPSVNSRYWSSTEVNSIQSNFFDFFNGLYGPASKVSTFNVRGVRAF